SRLASEGLHGIAARATDHAGNVGVTGQAITLLVDNNPLVMTMTSPAAGARVRDQVTATATVSEPVMRVEFSLLGAPTSVIVDTTAPYSATLNLSGFQEGAATVVATAIGL